MNRHAGARGTTASSTDDAEEGEGKELATGIERSQS
jgi:hypothetical protein